MRICYSRHRKESVLTGVRIKRVNFRENIFVILTQKKLTFTRRLLRLASFESENFTNSELAYSHGRMFSLFINNVNVSAA